MRPTANRRIFAVAVAVTALVVPSGLALAAPVQLFTASDFFIPRPASATDQEGVERPVADYDLAANGHSDLIGRLCTFTVLADNGDSVNANNYAIVRTGTEESDVYATESEANVSDTVMEDATLVLGPTIEMFNVMIPGAGDIVGTSVDFAVFVDCAAPATTTTTASTTSTTSAPTTSTSTTTPGQSTSTTAAATTSTSAPGSSTSDSTSTTIPATVTGTLPFTGAGGETALVLAAAALLALGGMGVAVARPKGRHSR